MDWWHRCSNPFPFKNINFGTYDKISIFFGNVKNEKSLIMCKLFEGYWWY